MLRPRGGQFNPWCGAGLACNQLGQEAWAMGPPLGRRLPFPRTWRALSHFYSAGGTSISERWLRRFLFVCSEGRCRGAAQLRTTPNGLRQRMRPSRGTPLRKADRISVAAINRYVRSCFARATTPRVSELAQKLAVSRGTLISAVKKLTGTTPAKYFRQQQVHRVKGFLRRGWPIELAAREAGYGTRRAFFRSFRTVTGTTPNVYRIEQSVPRQPRGRHDGVRPKATSH
jgi:methylphosphotriester-DNA--protein-cysteine methyltransferase